MLSINNINSSHGTKSWELFILLYAEIDLILPLR